MPSESIKPSRWGTFVFILGTFGAWAVGIIISLAFHNPGVGLGLMFFLAGGSFLSLILFGALRRGVISVGKFGSGSRYERHRNPIGFWFYISLFTLIFLGVTILGFVFVTHPSLLNNCK